MPWPKRYCSVFFSASIGWLHYSENVLTILAKILKQNLNTLRGLSLGRDVCGSTEAGGSSAWVTFLPEKGKSRWSGLSHYEAGIRFWVHHAAADSEATPGVAWPTLYACVWGQRD